MRRVDEIGQRDKRYGTIGYQYKKYVVHRLAWEREHDRPIPPGMQIDHLCFNRRCVRVDHMRLVTHKQNQENRRGANRGTKSGIRGVSKETRGSKWRAEVDHNGRRYYRGGFDSAEEAGEAARLMRLELHTHNDIDRHY